MDPFIPVDLERTSGGQLSTPGLGKKGVGVGVGRGLAGLPPLEMMSPTVLRGCPTFYFNGLVTSSEIYLTANNGSLHDTYDMFDTKEAFFQWITFNQFLFIRKNGFCSFFL